MCILLLEFVVKTVEHKIIWARKPENQEKRYENAKKAKSKCCFVFPYNKLYQQHCSQTYPQLKMQPTRLSIDISTTII